MTKHTTTTAHAYRRSGLVARPVWVDPAEAERVRVAAERSGLTQQEFMRRALLKAAGRSAP